MAEFAFALPKAELHVHIEGTLEPELAFAIGNRNGVELGYANADELRRAYRFADLASFLDVYYAVSSVLQTEEDFTEIADAYLARAAAQGVRHTEIFFDPQAHTARGVPIEAVIDGLHAATRRSREAHGLTAELVLCFLRDRSADEAMATWESALPHAGKFVAVGLDSAEAGNPPAKFEQVFAAVRQAGLHVVAHAGEEGPPEYVRQAIELLGVERIDHGVRALEDRDLVDYLAQHQVPLTVCPLSNVALGGCESIGQHRLSEMLAAGLNISIHSDDPAFFGGYVGDNFAAVQTGLGLSEQQLRHLAANSFRSAFLSDAERERYIESVHAE
jgi:adenosine deaminase